MDTSLKVAINRMMLVTFLLMTFVIAAFIFCYAQVKQTLLNRSIEESLRVNSMSQIELLLPSFLVEEQQNGIPFLLERFKEQEKLEMIQMIRNRSELSSEFIECRTQENLIVCISKDKRKVGVLLPIQESGHQFGYLLKVKPISNPFVNDHILLVIEVGAGVLILSFLLLFLFIGRLTSQELPNEISNLLRWLEDVLNEKNPTQLPQLKFQELNELGSKAAELIERQRRVRDHAMIGQLTSGIMHDIRTPFQSVVTAMYLADEQPNGSSKRIARLENLLSVCMSKIPGIGEVIESTLDINRNIHIDPQNKEIQETLSDALATHWSQAEAMKAKVVTDFGSPIVVAHDPVQLGRVFSNLFKNAIEAISLKSKNQVLSFNEIWISVRKVDEKMIKVIFEDSGTGLPENSDGIFRVFRSSKPKGSGLGLVISRKIVESHNGKLAAAVAERLCGARFEVVLPISY